MGSGLVRFGSWTAWRMTVGSDTDQLSDLSSHVISQSLCLFILGICKDHINVTFSTELSILLMLL